MTTAEQVHVSVIEYRPVNTKFESFDAVDLPLIRYVASMGKPMIMSTGMASEDEIDEAVTAAREVGCNDLVLLHCISSYPAPMDQANLRQTPELAKRFDGLAGLSDHTMGTTAVNAGPRVPFWGCGAFLGQFLRCNA